MKNRKNRLIISILIIIIITTILLFISNKSQFKLDAEKVEEIEISQNYKTLSGYSEKELDELIILDSTDDTKKIEDLISLLNKSTKYEDQDISTTFTVHIYIKYENDKSIYIGTGVGEFIRIAYDNKKYNYINYELEEYLKILLETDDKY